MASESRLLNNYHRINRSDIQNFIAIAGEKNIITSREKLTDYGHDEAPLIKPRLPSVVVKPEGTPALSKILYYCNRKRITVTARGAGTGLSGGCVPIYGGMVLSLEKMDSIFEIDRQNFTATVQPAVSLAKLREQIEPLGLSYPISLGEMSATIGGSIATNAGGLNAVKYGVTRHHVLGLEAVLADGQIVRTGGKFVKCSSGYDLTQLLTGSEGTLAIITQVILKLDRKSANREALFIPFDNLQKAIDAVPDILSLGKEPVGLEFMEKSIMQIAQNYTGKNVPCGSAEAFLLIISEADNTDEITGYFSEVEKIARKHGASEAIIPPGKIAMRRLLEVREAFYQAIKKYAPMQIIDAVVPRSEIARFISKVKQMEVKYGIPVVVYGHAGDGNIHLHPICENMPLLLWKRRLTSLTKDIYSLTLEFGGAISGEHGIGVDKRESFNTLTDNVLLDSMKKIKRALDPEGILNPGKIFS